MVTSPAHHRRTSPEHDMNVIDLRSVTVDEELHGA